MFQHMIPDELVRRIRIRSWKDAVLFIGVVVFWSVGNALLKKFAPDLSEITRSRIVTIVCIVVFVVGIFVVGA